MGGVLICVGWSCCGFDKDVGSDGGDVCDGWWVVGVEFCDIFDYRYICWYWVGGEFGWWWLVFCYFWWWLLLVIIMVY